MKQMTRLSLGELVTTARTLDLQILKLDRRGARATPEDLLRAAELKKMRLQAKDRLSELNHRYSR
jgi:hypothetical protein